MSDALLTQLRGRDPSLCLALAALIRSADDAGATSFDAAAVAYREDYLAALRRSAGDAGGADPGTLSVDDVRRHLATSVLPRLATEGVILDPGRGWTESSVVQFQPEAWGAIGVDRDDARQLLLEVAWLGMVTHDTGDHDVAQAGASAGSVLEAFGLRKTYSRRAVVDDVNVRLGQGEIVGLLGPNGAGKTTTFYMMVGLITPEAGRIALDGDDISTLPDVPARPPRHRLPRAGAVGVPQAHGRGEPARHPRDAADRRTRSAPGGSRPCSTSSRSATCAATRPTRSPAASGAGSRSPARW